MTVPDTEFLYSLSYGNRQALYKGGGQVRLGFKVGESSPVFSEFYGCFVGFITDFPHNIFCKTPSVLRSVIFVHHNKSICQPGYSNTNSSGAIDAFFLTVERETGDADYIVEHSNCQICRGANTFDVYCGLFGKRLINKTT